MPDVGNHDVEVGAPEERYGIESATLPENVASDRLALATCHNPVFDSQSLVRGAGPRSNIAACIYIGLRSLQILIHQDTVGGFEPSFLREINFRRNADS